MTRSESLRSGIKRAGSTRLHIGHLVHYDPVREVDLFTLKHRGDLASISGRAI